MYFQFHVYSQHTVETDQTHFDELTFIEIAIQYFKYL